MSVIGDHSDCKDIKMAGTYKGCLVAWGEWTINGIFVGYSSNPLSREINRKSNFKHSENSAPKNLFL